MNENETDKECSVYADKEILEFNEVLYGAIASVHDAAP